MEQWVEETHARIAAAIKRLRDEAGMSAQQLADRTAKLGHPISRSQIANYESARKKNLDITELVVLAAALNTSPVSLIYPGPYRQSVSIIPGKVVNEFEAVQWFSAEKWLNMTVVSDLGHGIAQDSSALLGDDPEVSSAAIEELQHEAWSDWRRSTDAILTWRLREEIQHRLNDAMRKHRDGDADAYKDIELYTKLVQSFNAHLDEK